MGSENFSFFDKPPTNKKFKKILDKILKIENSGHFLFSRQLMKPSWGKQLNSREKLAAFLGSLDESEIGVMIHSKDYLDPEEYEKQIRLAWKNSGY